MKEIQSTPTLDDTTEPDQVSRIKRYGHGACRDRTGDLRLAKPALSQLS